mmetsp:Transcript_40360/g.115966  ORF Transcript_40360/g.115966 Transcript_40360/m.115966 type:complete len:353 (+) Transcript_40360:884-1942(+)
MYRIQTMEVSPSVRSNRSKSSTLRGSFAQRPSACSASRRLTSSASAALAFFFCRLDNLAAAASSSEPSSSCSPSSSEELAVEALKSAKTKAASPPPAPEAAAARSHGAASSSESAACAAATSTFFLFALSSTTFTSLTSADAASFAFFSGGGAGSSSSSSSSSASSSSSKSAGSKRDCLRANSTLPFSILMIFARAMRSPTEKESTVTDAVSETLLLCTRPDNADLSRATNTPKVSMRFTRPLTTSPTDSCSIVIKLPLPCMPNSILPDTSSTLLTNASRMSSPGGCSLEAISPDMPPALKACKRSLPTNFRLSATNTPLSFALTTYPDTFWPTFRSETCIGRTSSAACALP